MKYVPTKQIATTIAASAAAIWILIIQKKNMKQFDTSINVQLEPYESVSIYIPNNSAHTHMRKDAFSLNYYIK